MLPVLRRFGSPSTRVDALFDDGLLGMSRDLDRWMDRVWNEMWNWGLPTGRAGAYTFPAEVVETSDDVRISIETPGFQLDDLDLTLEGNLLHVSGEKRTEQEDKNRRYWYSERQFGRFQRSFTLPESLETDRAEASYHDGVLEIRIPKREGAKPRRLKIQAARGLGKLLSGKKKEKEVEVQEA